MKLYSCIVMSTAMVESLARDARDGEHSLGQLRSARCSPTPPSSKGKDGQDGFLWHRRHQCLSNHCRYPADANVPWLNNSGNMDESRRGILTHKSCPQKLHVLLSITKYTHPDTLD